MTEIPPINIFIADEFKRAARALRKRYRNIDSDLEPLISETEIRTELAIFLWRGCANALFQQNQLLTR